MSTIEYTKGDDGPVCHLFARDANQIRHHLRLYHLYPFFYVNELEPVPNSAAVIAVERLPEWESISHERIKRIVTKLPEDIGGDYVDNEGLRSRFQQTFEDDILFTERVAIETGIKSGFIAQTDLLEYGKDQIQPIDFKVTLRRCHVDIETSSKESGGHFPSILNPKNRIYCINSFDSYDLDSVTFIYSKAYKNKKVYKQKYISPLDARFGFLPEYPLTIYTFNNEKDMLLSFMKYIQTRDPDILTGWNAKKFDFAYIIARCGLLGIKMNDLSPLHSVWVDKDRKIAHIKGRIVFDTWEAYEKLLTNKEESTKLGFVSKKLFGVGKVEHGGIDDDYLHNLNRLIKYNAQDAFLDYAIAERQKLFQFFYDVKCYVGCSFEDVLDNSRIIDMYMLFKAREAKIALPSKRGRDKVKKSAGAIVLQAPNAGIAKMIAVLDLKSLYPNCIRTLNMGADTKVYKPPEAMIPSLIKSPIENVYFRKDKRGFMAKIVDELLDYRDQMKDLVKKYKKEKDAEMAELYDRIQTVVKFIVNSMFGVMGFVEFRLFDKEIFDNILTTARIVIKFTFKILRTLGYKVHYADTDSSFIQLNSTDIEDAKKEADELVKRVNEKYLNLNKIFNIDVNTITNKVDEIYKTILMVLKKDSDKVAKKHYAGIKADGEIEIVGFDRSDMSICGNSIMKQVLEMAARGQAEAIMPFLKAEIAKIRAMQYPLGKIAFAKGISSAFESYKVKGNWIRAAEWTNQHSGMWGAQTDYGAGSKPKFMYMQQMLMPRQFERAELIALDDNDSLPQNLIECIDFDTLIQKTIFDKIDTILAAVGLNYEHIISKVSVKGINEY